MTSEPATRRPTIVQFTGGGRAFVSEPARTVRATIARARRNDDQSIRLNGRHYPLARITAVIAPDEAEAA
jgi:hypothetical protein